jgi:peptidoglycan hydrolase-like protein with peptidoglycan-binding domain
MKKSTSLVGVLAIMATVIFSLPEAASAATASCTGTTTVYDELSGWHHVIPTLGSGTSNYNCILGNGNNGSAVTALQKNLNFHYHRGLSVDGSYGPATSAAVKYVQHLFSLTEDGVYGRQTCGSMQWYFTESTNDSGSWRTCG